MDNESYNICLDLVEWFESVCQTVPRLELSRNCFYLNGKILRVSSPGILRVTLRNQASCGSFLSDLRKWIQCTVEYNANMTDDLDLNTSLTLISEMLEREIEKEKYRSFFHSWNNCSLHQHWYSGPNNALVARQSLKRKRSIKATVSGGEMERTVSTSAANTYEREPPKKSVRRTAVISDSDDDDDYSVSVSQEAESKKHKHAESSQDGRATLKPSKSASVKIRPVVSIKLSSEAATPDVKVKIESSSIHVKAESSQAASSISPALASEVVPSTPSSVASAAPSIGATGTTGTTGTANTTGTASTASIASAPKPRAAGSGDAELNKKLRAVVEELMRTPSYDLFVDPVPRSCADYYQLIETPICFRDILRKTQTCRYKSVSGFQRDVFTLITNCLYYNMLDDADQSSNRKQAYSLHAAFLRRLAAVDSGTVDKEDLVQLAQALFGVLEAVYKVRAHDFQLIRYFAVDPKQLPDYEKYVKKPIQLRAILTRLVSFEYTSTTKLGADFELLFDNCVSYWRKFDAVQGRAYIEAAITLSNRVADILREAVAAMPPRVADTLKAIEQQKAERKARQLEKRRTEARPSLITPSLSYEEAPAPAPPAVPLVPMAPVLLPPATLTRTQARNAYGYESQPTSWHAVAQRCLEILKTRTFPHWCWTIFLTPEERLAEQPEYTQEILTPISWRTIEAKLPTYDRTAFVASMRVMFDNCLAYNKLADSAPIHWIRDPCRFLYNEFNLLAAKLPPAAGPAEFKAVMEDLKRVRLAGYEPYFDFERNPLEYYSNYTIATRQPMGFLDTLHCRGSFEDWCGLVNEVFDAACRYHCNGRGSAFIFAEAKYLQRQFHAVADVARAVLARGGSAAEVRCEAVAEETSEEGVKVFEVEKTRLSGEETRKCKLVLDELAKWSVAKALNAYFERVPRANTFEYLSKVERLCYWSEIASNLRFGFYSSPEQLRTDLLTMINNSYLLCANREKKEMLSKNAEYLALLLSDLWRVLRLRDEGGTWEFLQMYKGVIKSYFLKEDVVEKLFRSFRNEMRAHYQDLLVTDVRFFTQKPQDAAIASEVLLSDGQSGGIPQIPALEEPLPSFQSVAESPQQQGVKDYWKLFNTVLNILTRRARRLAADGCTEAVAVHEKAKGVLMNVFALEMRSLVFQEHQKKYHVLIFAPHGLGEKKAAHRQPSYLVSSLTPEQRSVYNTPSLFVMKIAKKEVLRELRPEIVEKERSEKEKKEEMAATLKVRIVGKDVEKKEGDKAPEATQTAQNSQGTQSSQPAQGTQATQATPGNQTAQESATKPGEKEEAQEEVEVPVITFHL